MKYLRYWNVMLICTLLVAANSCDEDDDDNNGSDSIDLEQVADGFSSPVTLAQAPGDDSRLFVVDQTGQIYIIKDGSKLSAPFLDVANEIILEGSPDERGLLGLAFHPNYATNGRFYIYYGGPLRGGAPSGWNHTNYVAEYTVSENPDIANENGRVVLAMDHPQANHNGGTLAFGNDGYLYISVGDGGGGDDNATGHVDDWYEANTGGNGQDITQNLLGSILRIDVNTEEGYDIPSDNPFVGEEGLDEIYAYGLRNPYRFSFAPDNSLILADAGQELYEEIDVVVKGGNYGWNVKEGRHCFDTSNPEEAGSDCPDEDEDGNNLIDPVIEFKNSKSFNDGLGNVSVGGYVYDGDDVPSLDGKYIFGVLSQDPDGMDGAIFAADRTGNNWDYRKIEETDFFVLGFGQDNDGEVYVLTSGSAANSGKVYRIADDDSD